MGNNILTFFICYRGDQGLLDDVSQSMWCELTSPQNPSRKPPKTPPRIQRIILTPKNHPGSAFLGSNESLGRALNFGIQFVDTKQLFVAGACKNAQKRGKII